MNWIPNILRRGNDGNTSPSLLDCPSLDLEVSPKDGRINLSASSRLSRREIQGLLNALRNIDHRRRLNGEVVATPGEILREDEDLDWDSATDDNRVKTAESWLEDVVLLIREENYVQIFLSSLRVKSLQEAHAKLRGDKANDTYRVKLLLIVRALLESDPDEGVSTDELMMVSGLSAEEVRKALADMEEVGIANLLSHKLQVVAPMQCGINSQRRSQTGKIH